MRERWITDRPPAAKFPMYTRANAAEVLSDPCSPLGWTMVWEQGVALGCRDSFVRFHIANDDELVHGTPEPFGNFGGYMYNPLSLSRLLGVRMPGMSPELIDQAYFGGDPSIPPYEPEPWHENEENSRLLGERLVAIMGATGYPDAERDKVRADRIRAERPDFSTMSDAALVAYCRSLQPVFREDFDTHADVTLAASIPTGTVQALAGAVGHPAWAMPLIAGIGDVDSAAPSWALWDLSRLVRSSPELMSAFDVGVEGLLDRLAGSGSGDAARFLADFDAFLAAYGSRGPNEWEIIAEVWETRPTLALAAVDLMRRTGDAEEPRAKHARLQAERERLRGEMETLLADDPETLATFRAAMTSTDAHIIGRERSKANNVKVIHEARMATRELGRRLAAAGAVADPMHVYMVTDAELDAFLADPAAMRDEVARRWIEYRELYELEPPFVVNAEVPPLTTWPRRTEVKATPAVAGETLAGIAGCAGVARGRARVILDVADPAGLEPGDVLVTVATDPSWTPLFVSAAAVVTNTGAPASHAVIVSRELGIPCVVSVNEATRRIPDGALVEVDGDTGVVRVLEV